MKPTPSFLREAGAAEADLDPEAAEADAEAPGEETTPEKKAVEEEEAAEGASAEASLCYVTLAGLESRIRFSQ